MEEPKDETRQAVNIDLPTQLYLKMKAESDRLGVSQAGFLRMVLVRYFENSKVS